MTANLHRAAFLAIALLAATHAAAASFDALPALCRTLQKDGWGLPLETRLIAPDTPVETNLPGVMYLCTLARALPAHDRGRAPDLHAMLSRSGPDASAILSAAWFCAADRAPALAALRGTVADAAAALGLHPSDEVLAAVEAGQPYDAASDGARYTIAPVDVDPAACTRVPPGQIGAVLGKVDVEIQAE